LAVVIGQVCGVFALCFLPGPRPRRRFGCLPLGFEGLAAALVIRDDLVGIDTSTALLSHVRRSTSGCRQTYATVDILIACAHGAEVPTPLQPRIPHARPYRPSAIERFDAQAQARHTLIDDFILDAAPLIGEAVLTVSAVIRTGTVSLPGHAPKPVDTGALLGHLSC